MPKSGILHDYDLWANKEESAIGQRCAICDSFPMTFQWSDYSGEAMCTQCGCPYQLKCGTDEQVEKGNYPYINLTDDFIPIGREYWDKTNKFICYGLMLGPQPGMSDLMSWLKQNYPEFIKKDV